MDVRVTDAGNLVVTVVTPQGVRKFNVRVCLPEDKPRYWEIFENRRIVDRCRTKTEALQYIDALCKV